MGRDEGLREQKRKGRKKRKGLRRSRKNYGEVGLKNPLFYIKQKKKKHCFQELGSLRQYMNFYG